MKFSIITCTFNSAKWLRKNIESCVAQSNQNFEHIFIDAFSNDETVDLIVDYQNKFPDKIKLFQLKPAGISNAMNEGIRISSGDYLIHLHSDDSFFDVDVLSDVDSFLDEKKLDWVYGKINVVEENGRSVGTFPNRKLFQQNNRSYFGRYLLKYFNYIPHQAVFISKNVFKKFGNFDASLSSAMDSDLWLKIRKSTKWCFYDRVVSNYCIRNTSESASLKNKAVNIKNYRTVQNRYMNVFERLLSRLFNYFLDKYNKNYR